MSNYLTKLSGFIFLFIFFILFILTIYSLISSNEIIRDAELIQYVFIADIVFLLILLSRTYLIDPISFPENSLGILKSL